MPGPARLFRIAIAIALGLAIAPAARGSGTGGAFEPGMRPAACSAFRNCATLDVIPNGIGTGSGTITDDQGQIDCTIVPGSNAQGSCSGAYDWAPSVPYITVKLTLTPASGSYGCVTGLFCGQESQPWTHGVALYPNASPKVGIEFDVKLHQLVVSTSGTGSGTITSAQFSCASYPCDAGMFPWGTELAFEATAALGSAFLGWTGACATQPATCSLTLSADSDTTAVFSTVIDTTPKPTHATGTPRATGAPRPSTIAATPAATPRPGTSTGATAGSGGPAELASLPVAASPGATSPAASSAAPPAAILLIIGAGVLVLAAAGLVVASRRRPTS